MCLRREREPMKFEVVKKLNVNKENDFLELEIEDMIEIEFNNGNVGVFTIEAIHEDGLTVNDEEDCRPWCDIRFAEIKDIRLL